MVMYPAISSARAPPRSPHTKLRATVANQACNDAIATTNPSDYPANISDKAAAVHSAQSCVVEQLSRVTAKIGGDSRQLGPAASIINSKPPLAHGISNLGINASGNTCLIARHPLSPSRDRQLGMLGAAISRLRKTRICCCQGMLDEASFLYRHQIHARSFRFIYHHQSGPCTVVNFIYTLLATSTGCQS
jgi:hypothetical protein